MKIVVLIVRLLIGLLFLVFGLNAFLQFLNGPIPGGLAGQFLQALFQSHFVLAIGAVQAVGGVLLLINRYVPLALTILGPVIVDILLYHLLLNHERVEEPILSMVATRRRAFSRSGAIVPSARQAPLNSSISERSSRSRR